ncbi:MAG: primase C-terminal domain-containing protein [Candidatus Caldarchaeum sp.]
MRLTTLKKFIGNPHVFAVQQPDGTYRPIRQPLTDEALQEHLLGKVTYGTYVLNFDKARFFMFDIDNGDITTARALLSASQKYGFRAVLEESGRKGYHVWVLLTDWYKAADVRRVAKAIAAEVGFTGEVFPKQDTARDLGNLVKLPCGVHQVTGARCRLIGTVVLNPLERLETALSKLPAPSSRPSGTSKPSTLPCLDSIQENPPQVGQRNILLFHMACHLRRMGLQEQALAAALAVIVPPEDLDPGEFEAIVRNSEFSGPICDQLPEDRKCPPEYCVKTRSNKALSQRPGQLRNAVEGEPVVMIAGPRTPGSNVVPLTHPDAEAVKAALRTRKDGN